jgi:hypothetical protein
MSSEELAAESTRRNGKLYDAESIRAKAIGMDTYSLSSNLLFKSKML